MSDDRRAVLEGILYGTDARISPRDRLAALEALREYEPPPSPIDGLSEEQILAEADGWHAMMLGAMFMAGGPHLTLDPQMFPRTAERLHEVVQREVQRELGNRALQDEERRQDRYREQHEQQREDVVDAEAVDVREPVVADALPTGRARRQLGPPKGIDPAAGWRR